MKETIIALCAILALARARVVITADDQSAPHLLGLKECTWGPSYWCQNITTAAGCGAVGHCISKTWEKMEVPDDNDSVCGICKDMVQQARDQLESNQTMEDLKAVFEGSCRLIHIKPVVEECVTLADQFIPELVETLASQMNPSVVCTVAGLCNSAHIDRLLLDYQNAGSKDATTKSMSLDNDELEPDECSKCFTIATHMEHKFNNTPRDNVAEQMLRMCGELSSYSDACSSIVLSYFDVIYSHLQKNLKAKNVCHLSGQCSGKFHKHEDESAKTPNVEVRPLSSVGMVEVDDDLPCKLCEQLVGHLRDLLVANTTEAEFQQVLQGLCTQTKSFATECKAIVDEYYPEIYNYLTKGLNSNLICQMSGICPAPDKISIRPIWPLVPTKTAQIGIRIFKEKSKHSKPVVRINENDRKTEAEEMQLPADRMNVHFGPSLIDQNNGGSEACALCEYVLHYLQEAITNPTTEDKVKHAVEKVCVKLPKTIQDNCEEFVETYGDAIVAILVQEIDPSQVCPMLHLCPSDELLEVWRQAKEKDYIIEVENEKPSCPLCLLALTQIYNSIKNNKTEAGIEAELDKLCTHLPQSLSDECRDLVKGYSKEIVEMLLADLTPQEICVYIKLCDPTKNPGPRTTFLTDKDGEIMTNEIPDFPLHPPEKKQRHELVHVPQLPVHSRDEKGVTGVTCVICEFAMQYVDKAMKNKKTRDEIEHIVYGICNHLPKTTSKECNDFVNEYADVIIGILSEDVSPKEVCTMIGLCWISTKQVQAESVAECALCQMVTSTTEKLLKDPKVDEDIEEVTSKVCKFLPATEQNKCVMMMEVYEQSIINILESHGDPKTICSKIALCSANDYLLMSLNSSRQRRSIEERSNFSTKRCTWGETYWCSSDEAAAACQAVEYCKNVWKADSAPAARQVSSEAN